MSAEILIIDDNADIRLILDELIFVVSSELIFFSKFDNDILSL